jgi:phage terminase large subunit-like protein
MSGLSLGRSGDAQPLHHHRALGTESVRIEPMLQRLFHALAADGEISYLVHVRHRASRFPVLLSERGGYVQTSWRRESRVLSGAVSRIPKWLDLTVPCRYHHVTNELAEIIEYVNHMGAAESIEALCDQATAIVARSTTCDWLEYVVWPVVEPGTPFVRSWHLEYVGEHLDALVTRQIRYLFCNGPRRMTKSRLFTVAAPTRHWAIEPAAHLLLHSYDEELMTGFASERRAVMQSRFFETFWPAARLVGPRPEAARQTNVSGGKMIGTMTFGTGIGVGGHLRLDDPMSEDQYNSVKPRNRVNRWLAANFGGCFNNPKTDTLALVAQRLGFGDPTDFFLSRTPPGKAVHIVLANYPVHEPKVYVFPISGRVVHQALREPMCPERMGVEEIEACSLLLDGDTSCTGPNFSAQQNQECVSTDNPEYVRHAWLRFWCEPCEPDHVRPPVTFATQTGRVTCPTIALPGKNGIVDESAFDFHCSSWDNSGSANARSADTAWGVWSRMGQLKFLRDFQSAIMDLLSQLDEMAMVRGDAANNVVAKWPLAAAHTYIENKSHGAAILDGKRYDWDGLIAVDPRESKAARLKAVLPEFRAGHVILPHPDIAPGVLELIAQITGPTAKQDLKDMTTQALRMMRETPSFEIHMA